MDSVKQILNRILSQLEDLKTTIRDLELTDENFESLNKISTEFQEIISANVSIESHQQLASIKLVLSDVDGVLTDAGMYYSENGEELKKFHTHDGMGFQLLMEKGFKVGILTSEDRRLNQNRSHKLGLDFTFQGVKDKLKKANQLVEELGIDLSNVAYIGDDINDFELLSEVGLAACPVNAIQEIKRIPNIIQLQNSGGNGAFREFSSIILSRNYQP